MKYRWFNGEQVIKPVCQLSPTPKGDDTFWLQFSYMGVRWADVLNEEGKEIRFINNGKKLYFRDRFGNIKK